MPTPSHRPIPVSPLTILFLLAGCPWDVPGMSPLPLRPQIDPDPGIQPSPSKISVSSGNGAVPARAFSSPFPAGSSAAPAPMGGAGMSESHPEFGGAQTRSPCPNVPSLSRCHPEPTAAPGMEPPGAPGLRWDRAVPGAFPAPAPPSRAGIRCLLTPNPQNLRVSPRQCHLLHPRAGDTLRAPRAPSCPGRRAGGSGDRAVPTPGPRGTPRTHRLRSDFATS